MPDDRGTARCFGAWGRVRTLRPVAKARHLARRALTTWSPRNRSMELIAEVILGY